MGRAANQSRKRSEPELPVRAEVLPADEFGQSLVSWLMPIYVFMIVVAMFVFRFGHALPRGNEMSPDRALFTAVNAATLSGFPQITGPNVYRPLGQAIIVILTIGGALFSMVCGGMAVKRVLSLPYSDWRIIRAAIIALALAALVGLCIPLDAQRDTSGSMSQTLAAFANCGVYIGHTRGVLASTTHLVLLPLAVLGGLGLPVLIEIYDMVRGKRSLSTHAWATLAMTGGLYLASMVLLIGLQLTIKGIDISAPSSDPGSLRGVIATSSSLSVNARTAGLPLDSIDALPRAAQWTLMIFMMIGASSASTGGGLKTTTLVVLIRDCRRQLRGETVGRPFAIALSWVGLYLLIVAITLIVLLATEDGATSDRLAFISISAASNVGLAHDPVAFTAVPLYILSLAMLAGRIVPVMMLWWVADTARSADLAVG